MYNSNHYPITWRNEIDLAFKIAQETRVIEPVAPPYERRLRFFRKFAHGHRSAL